MSSPDPRVPVAGSRGLGPASPAPVELPFDVSGLYPLRAALAAHASQLGASDEQIERLTIVAGELASNAIRHGGGSGRLRLWQHGTALYCEVSDEGPGFADRTVGTTPPDPTASN